MTRIYISYRSEDADMVQRIYNRAIETYGRSNILLNPEERLPHDVSRMGEFLEKLGSYRTGRIRQTSTPVEAETMTLDLALEDLIDNLMSGCDVVLLIVGTRWTGVDEFGRFLLSSADVPVGIEVTAALRSECRVIPVLINGMRALPSPDELPEEMHAIYEHPPVIVRPEYFDTDIRQLIAPPTLFRRLEYWLTFGWLNRRVIGDSVFGSE